MIKKVSLLINMQYFHILRRFVLDYNKRTPYSSTCSTFIYRVLFQAKCRVFVGWCVGFGFVTLDSRKSIQSWKQSNSN